MFGHITKWQTRREQRRAERVAALERRKREQNEHELVRVSDMLLLNHIEECCVAPEEFTPEPGDLDTHGIDIPGLEIELKSTRSPGTGRKTTTIKVVSSRLHLMLIRKYSHRAKCVDQKVCGI
jgi:hypothetical protein